ncbi:MAG: hypothetical protein U1E51_31885, partial [Candidatus Binatia bacterium]|nr:hypothetical protein [Candidatus Binatia bacterium]
MPDHSDFLVYKQAQEAASRTKVREQLILQRGVGVAMTELLSDPHWQLYAEHIEALAQECERRAEGSRQKLNGSVFLSDKEYGQTKLDQVEKEAEAKGMRRAL